VYILSLSEYREFFEGNVSNERSSKTEVCSKPEDFPYDKSMEIGQKDFELCKISQMNHTIKSINLTDMDTHNECYLNKNIVAKRFSGRSPLFEQGI